ncbi:MAG: hypothetical protein AAB091_07575, partial [Elusimicrobiota bacterium]
WKDYFLVFRSWIEIAGVPRNGAPWLGPFCLGAIAWHRRERTKHLALWLLPIAVYTAITLPTPMVWGYMLPIFPIFLILAGGFLENVAVSNQTIRRLVLGLAGALAAGCLAKSLLLDYGLSLKDSRTVAKEWIEVHIPAGSKILMGNYPYSPPLLQTYKQLKSLHQKAIEIKSYKEQYLKLQIEAHPGTGHGYELYTIGIPPIMVGALVHMAKEAQQMQNLVPYDQGLDYLRQSGIQYVITNRSDEENAKFVKNAALVSFYEQLRRDAKLLNAVTPDSRWAVGPAIFIFQL